jgi:hypothetical protein
MTRVRLYGALLELPSPMPGTEAAAANAPVDVVLHFGSPPASPIAREVYRSASPRGAAPTLIVTRMEDGAMRFAFAEGARFTVAADGRTVWAEWDAPLTEADAYTFFAGPVMGVVLRAHGALALHASAVVLGAGAWALVGPGGAGKSTLAAACAMDGAPVLSEDLLALRPDGRDWLGAPGHHQLRVWPEGQRLLIGDEAALPSLTPAWPKLAFDLADRGLPRATSDTALRGLIVLGPHVAEGAMPEAEPLPPREAVVELVANAYANHLLDGAQLARELVAFGAMATSVPAWRVRAPRGREGLARTVAFLRSLATK